MIDTSNNNYKIINNLELTSQEVMLFKSLIEFYETDDYFNLLKSIINGTNKISRRTIEYFVTNYSQIYKINFDIIEKGNTIKLYVHNSYKDKLKAHRKKYFDPFGRGIRIPFFTENDCIITTIGQLNFYKWFISKKIYDYCLDNYDIIQTSLIETKKNIKKKKINYTKQKPVINKIPYKYDYAFKKELSHSGDIIVSFDF